MPNFIINSTSAGDQTSSSHIAVLANGNFVAVWTSEDDGDGSGSLIRGRLFSNTGDPTGSDFPSIRPRDPRRPPPQNVIVLCGTPAVTALSRQKFCDPRPLRIRKFVPIWPFLPPESN